MSAFYRCDYCYQLTPTAEVKLYWVLIDLLDDGSGVYTSGLYCSDPCAELSSSRAGTVRG
jgi:hypothetical protein